MLKYCCDNCGRSREVTTGIVGGEYSYSDRDGFRFHTLAPGYRREGIIDVCGWCLEAVEKAVRAARAQHVNAEAGHITNALTHMRSVRSAGIRLVA